MAEQGSSAAEGGTSADGTGPPGLLDSRPSWCNYRSIVDILDPTRGLSFFAKPANQLPHSPPPFSPPVEKYLEEVLMCLQHGPGDQRQSPGTTPSGAAASWGGGTCSGSSLQDSPAYKVQLLQDVFKCGGDVVSGAGGALFWIVVGGVFGRIPACSLDRFRDALSEHWFMLNLTVSEHSHSTPESRDWVLAAFPVIFAQVFYRILCDAFTEDRKDFIDGCAELLEKLTLVSHFELTGFQLTTETVRRARRQLFVKTVLQNPHVNRLEFLRGLKRQEELENQSLGDRPLAFGQLEDGRPLDETQLEHVMQGRYTRRASREYSFNRTATSSLGATSGSVAEPTENASALELLYRDLPRPPPYQAPPDLSVDNYHELTVKSHVMFERQQQELAALLNVNEGDIEEEVDDSGSFQRLSSQESGSNSSPKSITASPLASGTPTLLLASPKADGGMSSDVEDPHSDAEEPPSPVSRQSARWKKLRVANKAILAMTAKDRKEKEAKLRRFKHEALHKHAAKGPLPPELCDREVLTTWVSPMTKRLTPAEPDRCLLRKSASETFLLKMETKPISMMPLPLSATRGRSAKVVAAAMIGDASQAKEATEGEASAVGPIGIKARKMTREGHVLVVAEPPGNLKDKVIVQRLDTQIGAFRKTTFKEYVKEYDVLTGDKKSRLDAGDLQKQEEEMLSRDGELVGGPPKRLVPPMGVSHKARTSE